MEARIFELRRAHPGWGRPRSAIASRGWCGAGAGTLVVVLGAHDAAVAAMVNWIEAHVHTRYRINGEVATLDADGIVAACFRQHTSRALDPQLHTHVVIANRVAADDGRWLALDARTIKLDQRTLSAVYHASLRAELTRCLGVAREEPANGIAEMRDVPEEVRIEFSSRTRAVKARIEDKLEHFIDQLQREPTPGERLRLEREAVTESRPAKSHGEDAQSLHQAWGERGRAIGYASERLAATLGPTPAGRALDDATAERVVTRVLEALADRQSAWRPAELVRELAAAVPADVAVPAETLVPWLDGLAKGVVAERLIELSPPVPDGVALRRDGPPHHRVGGAASAHHTGDPRPGGAPRRLGRAATGPRRPRSPGRGGRAAVRPPARSGGRCSTSRNRRR